MVADLTESKPVTYHVLTPEERTKGRTELNRKLRFNSLSDLIDMQLVLRKIVTGAVRYQDEDGEVIDIPAREIAACAKAYQVLEAQRRMNLGKANPAPIKSESRKRGRGSIPAVRPVPEPSQEAAPRITSTDSNTLDTIPPANVTEAKPQV